MSRLAAIFFDKIKNIYLKMLSAAVVIGALRVTVTIETLLHCELLICYSFL